MMVVEEREVTEWMKLPLALQHKFFEEAEKEAKKCKEKIMNTFEKLRWLKGQLRFEPVPKDDRWREWRVAVIDGSNSPVTSERLGGRYGAYCAGFMIFEGDKPVEEGYRSGSFSQDQLGSQDTAQRTLTLLRIRLERELALLCTEKKDVDLILIDGSFFGFKRDAFLINSEIIKYDKYSFGKDLTKEVVDLTMKVLQHRNAVGVIKRSRLAVIDGWLIAKYASLKYALQLNDKHILAYLMKPAEWFAYRWILEDSKLVHYYEAFRDTIIEREAGLIEKADVDRLFQATKNRVDGFIRKILGAEPSQVLCTTRYFIKCSATAPPFEVEAHIESEIEPVLSYFLSFHNPATGLPWPIDLIDANASLPRGFTKEFVEEIEARLMKDPEVADKLALLQHFSYLNPQKDED